MRVQFSDEERACLEFICETEGREPEEFVRELVRSLADDCGPCLDPRRNDFEAFKLRRAGASMPPPCTKRRPCAAHAALARGRAAFYAFMDERECAAAGAEVRA